MKIFWVVLLFLGVGGMVEAQPGIQWQKALGGTDAESSYSIVQTTDKGFITTGFVSSEDGDVVENHGYVDYWVVKLDSNSMVQWKKCYGGSSHDWAYSIIQTTDEGYVVAGNSESNDGDVSGNHGDKDMWILKLDNQGNIQWQKSLGGSSWETAECVNQTDDGGYIVAGRTSSTDGDVTGFHGYLDYWVVKLSANGELEWQKSLGGSDLDIGYSVVQTYDGGYVVTGEAHSQDGDIKNSKGNSDFWVVKLNFEGKIIWEKSLGGSGFDRANDLHQTRDGGYIVYGQTRSTSGDVTGHHGGYDCWAVKLNETGDLEWQKALGGSGDDFGLSIEQTHDDGFILASFTRSINGDIQSNHGETDAWVVKLTAAGDIQWQKTMGGTGPDRGYSIHQTTDGGYIMSGDAWVSDGDVTGTQGKGDFWIVKLSPETSPTTTPSTQALQLYPNPAQNTLSLKIPETIAPNTALTFQITDLLGREVLQKSIFDSGLGSVDLDIAKLPGGLYWVQASSSEGEVFVGKFQKLD